MLKLLIIIKFKKNIIKSIQKVKLKYKFLIFIIKAY